MGKAIEKRAAIERHDRVWLTASASTAAAATASALARTARLVVIIRLIVSGGFIVGIFYFLAALADQDAGGF